MHSNKKYGNFCVSINVIPYSECVEIIELKDF